MNFQSSAQYSDKHNEIAPRDDLVTFRDNNMQGCNHLPSCHEGERGKRRGRDDKEEKKRMEIV